MKKYLFTIIFFLGLVLPTGFAYAAFNPQINYQGRLTTPAGIAVPTGSYNIQFNLYTVPTGGTSIWTETDCYSTNNGSTCTGSGTDQRIVISNGLFSVMLGSTTPFTNVNFNQTLYLGVNIGGSATTPSYDGEMTPRKILGAVPAAMYSGTSTVALTLNGLSSSQFFRSDAPNSTSSATTSLSVTQLGSGKIAEFFGSSSQSVLSILSNGNVGIGTSTPGTLLSVGGNAYFGGNLTATGTFSVAGTTTLATSLNGLLFGTNGVVSAVSTSSLGIANYWTLSGSNLYKNSGTNVGIGTSTPGSALTVVGNGSFSGNLLVGSGFVSATGTNAFSGGNADGVFGDAIQSSGIGSFAFGQAATGGSVITSSGAGSVAMGDSLNGSVIQASGPGNVALGLTDIADIGPNALGIISSGHGSFAAGYGSDSSLVSSGSGSVAMGYSTFGGPIISSGQGSIALGDSSDESLLASGLADIALGESAEATGPRASVAIGDDVNALASDAFAIGKGFTNSATSTFKVGFSSNPTLTVTATSVGIGSSTPGSLLAVQGNAFFGGNVTATGTLTVSGTTTLASALNGFLQATNGVVSATSSPTISSSSISGIISVANGGTGTSTAPTLNQLLIGNAAGGYSYISTSSLGISGTNYFTNSSATTSLAVGSILTSGTGSFGTINATSTTGSSTISGRFFIGRTAPTYNGALTTITASTTNTFALGVTGDVSFNGTQFNAGGPAYPSLILTNDSHGAVEIGDNENVGSSTVLGVSDTAGTITGYSSSFNLSGSSYPDGLFNVADNDGSYNPIGTVQIGDYAHDINGTNISLNDGTQNINLNGEDVTVTGNNYPDGLFNVNDAARVITVGDNDNDFNGTNISVNDNLSNIDFSATSLNSYASTNFFGHSVGIATSTPIDTLSVEGAGGQNPFVVASSTGKQLLSILQNGNVGIGSSTPGSLLAVGGNAYFGGNVTATGTLTVSGTTTLASVLNGFLQATNGVISATSSPTISSSSISGVISVANGGTGTSTAPTLNQLLIGNAAGGYSYVATSSLGFPVGSIGSGIQGQVPFYNATGTALIATSSLFIAQNGFIGIGSTTPGSLLAVGGNAFFAGNVTTAGSLTVSGTTTLASALNGFLQATNGVVTATSSPTISSSSISGIISVAKGGTGSTSYSVGSILLGNTTNALTQLTASTTGLILLAQGLNTNPKWVATSSLGITGSITSVSNGDGSLTISPTTGNVVASINTGNSNTWSANQYFNNDVGIQQSSPAYPLDVNGDIGDSATGDYQIGQNGDDTYFNATNGGSVGIGTNSPGTPLQVVQTGGGDVITAQSTDSSGQASVVYDPDNGCTGEYFTGAAGSANSSVLPGGFFINACGVGNILMSDHSGDFGIGGVMNNTFSGALIFADSAVHRVGILNTSPNYTLDVAGDINTTGCYRIGGICQTFLASPLTTKGDLWGFSTTSARVPVGANGTLLEASSGAALGVAYVSTSTLGLGTVNSGTAGQLAVYNSSGSVVSGTSTLFIQNGNFGIGSTSPSASFSFLGSTTSSTSIPSFVVYAGNGIASSSTAGAGSGILLVTGNALSEANGATGGDANFITGSGASAATGGRGGNINFTLGTGGVSGASGGVGGSFSVLAGNGGSNTSAPTGVGGAISLTAGNGGAQSSATPNNANGGAVTITSGNGGSVGGGGDNGGNILLLPGTGAGTGVGGFVGIGTSTPIARFSLVAATNTIPFVVASSSGSQYLTLLQSGNFGIGTSTPGSILTVVGNIFATATTTTNGLVLSNLKNTVLAVDANGNVIATTTSAVVTGVIAVANGGTGAPSLTSGDLLYGNGTSPVATSSNLSYNGTTLTVSGSGANPTIYSPNPGNGLILRGDSNGAQLRIVTNTNAWLDNSTTTYFQMTNNTNNNVSFMGGSYGTDAALNRLQFSASSTQFTDLAYGSDPVPTSLFGITNSTAAKRVFTLVGAASQSGDFMDVTANGGSVGGLFDINSSGNVGIGTTTPGVALDVYRSSGNTQGRFQNGGAGTADFLFANTNDVWEFGNTAYGVAGFNIADSANNGIHMSIQSSSVGIGGTITNTSLAGATMVITGGNVGIGTTTPIATFAVKGTGSTNPFVVASSSGSQLMTVLANGNLGIGSSTPGSLLSVAGNIFATATTTTNGLVLSNLKNTFLSVDGSGNVTATTSPIYFSNSSATTSLTTGSILSALTGSFGTVNATSTTGTSTFAGGVGIEDKTPLEPLSVGGPNNGYNLFLTTTAGWSSGDTTGITFGDTSGGSSLSVPYSTSALWSTFYGIDFKVGNTGNTPFAIGSDGGTNDVGIGGSIATSTLAGAVLTVKATGTSLFSGAVGIENTLPGEPLSVGGPNNGFNILTSPTSGWASGDTTGIAFGDTSGNSSILVSYSTSALWSSYYGIDFKVGNTGNTPFAIGSNGGTNDIALGGNIATSTFAGATMVVRASGNVGIGTTTPASTLDVGGNITDESVKACDSSTNALGTTASGTIVCDTSLSDQRLKTDITTLDGNSALNLIDSLNPVSFYWIDPTIPGTGSTNQQFGFIAQQVDQVAPNLISTTTPTYLTPGFTYSLNYTGIIAPLVKAVQEQELQISTASSTLSSTTAATTLTLNGLSDQVGSLVASMDATTTQLQNEIAELTASTSAEEQELEGEIEGVASTTTSSLSISASSTASIASSTAATLSTSSSFVQTITNAVMAAISSTSDWVVNKMSASIIVTNDIQTQTLEAQSVTTQTASITNGFQMTDQATGYIYCVQLVDGEFAKTLGTCALASSTTPTFMESPATTNSNSNTSAAAAPVSTPAATPATTMISTTTATSTETSTSSSATVATSTQTSTSTVASSTDTSDSTDSSASDSANVSASSTPAAISPVTPVVAAPVVTPPAPVPTPTPATPDTTDTSASTTSGN